VVIADVGIGEIMTLTKRDITEIIFIWMGLSFLTLFFYDLGAIGQVVTQLRYIQTGSTGISLWPMVGVQVVHALLSLLLIYVFLFRHSTLLTWITPDGPSKEVVLPTGLITLTSFAFWIRLFGIYTLFSGSIKLISGLGARVPFLSAHFSGGQLIFYVASEILTILIGIFMIAKADWLGDKLGGSKAVQTTTDGEASMGQGKKTI